MKPSIRSMPWNEIWCCKMLVWKQGQVNQWLSIFKDHSEIFFQVAKLWYHNQKSRLRARLVTLFNTQCSVFKYWTLVSKILKNVFGHHFQNRAVWKLLLQNPCLNNVFWNVLGADFKQQTGVSSGTSVIKLNTLRGPPDQLFWIFVSSLYSHLFTPQTQIPGTKKITQSEGATHLHNSHPPP